MCLLLLGLLLLLLVMLLEVWIQGWYLAVWSVREVDAGRRRWHLALCLEQARLEVDDVVAKLVVLGLQVLVQFAQLLKLLDLVLELLDIFLLALTKCALIGQYRPVYVWWPTYLSGSVLCSTLARRQLSPTFTPFTVVAGVGLAHVVLRAGDGWIDVLLWPAGMRLLLLLLDRCGRTGLTSAGSKEMLS